MYILNAALFLLLSLCAFLPPEAGAAQGSITIVGATGDAVRQYEMFNVTCEVCLEFSNPYDYDEVDLAARIIEPDGKIVDMPAFYTGRQSLWMVRYAPVKKGKHTYRLILKNRPDIAPTKSMHFNVTHSSGDGFLRKGEKNPYHPVFDSGKPFFGIGHNIAWVTNNNINTYRSYFRLMKENGCNLTRIWLNAPWTFRVESEKAGRYNNADAEKFDELMGLAKEYGIYIILVFDTYASLMEERGPWEEQSWKTNPYNKLNGGPCEKPWGFFTSKEAAALYKNRVKYMVARWSSVPNIMAFELWNETDAPPEWVSQMSLFIKSVNPHGQFITTSLGYPWGNNFDESSIWRLPELDMIDRHLYGNTSPDIIPSLIAVNKELSRAYNKFLLIGEFGLDANKSDADIDVRGDAVSLHNGLWAGALSGACATPLNWWWAEYIKKRNLYHHYKAFKNFVAGVDWSSADISFVNTTRVFDDSNKYRLACPEMTIKTADAWGDKSFTSFTIHNNGDVEGGVINAYLHGSAKKELRLEPVIHVNYPLDGKFIISVEMVSQGANLVVELDGRQALSKELPAGPGTGPWKRSLYRKDYNIYQCVYDAKLSIDVPKGEHNIKLSNTGLDWIRIKNIALTNYSGSGCANARIVGLAVGGHMLFWIQNKAYNTKDINSGLAPETIKGAYFGIPGIQDGSYSIEWWDTFLGKITNTEYADSKNGELNIIIPPFDKDIACKVIKR